MNDVFDLSISVEFVLKLLGAALTTGFAVYGTYNDYKEDDPNREGKKRVTRAGRIGVVGTLAGLLITITTTGLENADNARKSRSASEQAEAATTQARKLLDQVSGTLQEVKGVRDRVGAASVALGGLAKDQATLSKKTTGVATGVETSLGTQRTILREQAVIARSTLITQRSSQSASASSVKASTSSEQASVSAQRANDSATAASLNTLKNLDASKRIAQEQEKTTVAQLGVLRSMDLLLNPYRPTRLQTTMVYRATPPIQPYLRRLQAWCEARLGQGEVVDERGDERLLKIVLSEGDVQAAGPVMVWVKRSAIESITVTRESRIMPDPEGYPDEKAAAAALARARVTVTLSDPQDPSRGVVSNFGEVTVGRATGTLPDPYEEPSIAIVLLPQQGLVAKLLGHVRLMPGVRARGTSLSLHDLIGRRMTIADHTVALFDLPLASIKGLRLPRSLRTESFVQTTGQLEGIGADLSMFETREGDTSGEMSTILSAENVTTSLDPSIAPRRVSGARPSLRSRG